MKKIKRMNMIANILFGLLILFVLPLSLPKVFGFSTYSVLSNSMEPAISTGALVYVKPIAGQSLQNHDIITFYGKQSSIVTHRIVSIENSLITTKGDHNEDVDITKVPFKQVIGKVIFSIPFYGYVFSLFGNVGGIFLFLIMLFVIIMLWSYTYRVKNRNDREK